MAAAVLRKSLVAVVVGFAGLAGVAIIGYVAVPPVATEVVLSAHSLAPVLPLPANGGLTVALGDVARDPEAVRHEPESEAEASSLASEIKQMRDDLARASGPRALELHEQTYVSYAALAYFLEDALAGRRQYATDANRTAAQLQTIRGFLLDHARAVARQGDGRAKARAIFHINATAVVSGDGRGAAIAELRKLEKSPLDAALKRRAALLVAMHDADHGSAAERAKAVQTLRSQAGGLGAGGQVAVRLTLARVLAGVSAAGHKAGPTKPEYRGQLAAALPKAAGLGQHDKDAALAAAVQIWRQAEGAKIDWSKAPFRMGPYADSATVRAIVERSALQDWQQNRRPQALRKYQSLAASAAGTPLKADLDLRVLDLRRADYAQSKNPKPYEAALLAAAKVYVDTGVLGGGHEAQAKATAAEVLRRYKALVGGELAHAAQKSASPTERRRAIAMAGTFIGTLSDAKEIEDIKAKVANIYALAGQHREAVAAYQELAETSTTGNVKRYWGLAIRSQSVLAAWPEQAPWGGVKAGHAAEREQLLVLYKKLGEADAGKNAWFLAAHIGLLDLSLGKADEAFGLWQTMLKQAPSGMHAANAAGTMLTAYAKAGAWSDLESLARVCLANRLTPVYQGRTVGAEPMLALALLEGGKQALNDGKFAVAIAKLHEFVAQHQAAKNHDEGFFLLAVAYHGAGRHEDSIKTLQAFADRYPRSKYSRQALLSGGDWAAPMAFEENVMFFYTRFLKQFATDPEAPRVRGLLTELFEGRGRYAEAIAVLQQTARLAPDAAVRAQALAHIMNLEERHGSLAHAGAAADQVLRAGAAPADERAAALAVKARLAAAAGRDGDLRRIEAQLASLQAEGAQDALGEVRYLLAEAESQTVVKTYFNLSLKDPQATLAQRYRAYQGATAAFLRVCQAGQTSFCAPAMLKLSQLSLAFSRSLDDLNVQDTLAKEDVQRFRAEKQRVMNEAAQTAQQADAQASASVGQGNADPDWAQAVLWQNSSDWNFDRVSGETGNGFVQWTAGDAGDAAAAAAGETAKPASDQKTDDASAAPADAAAPQAE